MDDLQPQGSTWSRFWGAWRREILRGALLFGAVLVVGLSGMRLLGWFGAGWLSPFELSGSGERNWEEAFVWAGTLRPGTSVFIRNLNGPVTVEGTEGDSVFVVAEKSWHHSDPEVVRVDAVPHAGGITFCAVWEARDASCGPAGKYHVRDPKRNDVNVRFTVRLPRGVGVDVSTVNGDVEIAGVIAAVVANTVNGAIQAEIMRGPFTGRTVNGAIDVGLGPLPAAATGAIALETVNGSITADITQGVNAVIDVSTVNGRIENALPMVASGETSSRKLVGRIGRGGPRVTLQTVNGAVNLSEREREIPVSSPTPPAPPTTPRPPGPKR